MTNAPIGIVVVNYASSDLLRSTLGAVRPVKAEVVVVDNFSTTDERRAVSDLATDRAWNVVLLPDNRGFGPGVNAGVARARELGCESLLLLNPDVRATAAVIESLRLAVERDPMALVSPRHVDLAGKITFSGSSLNLRDGRTGRAVRAGGLPPGDQLIWLTAACLAVSVRLWERVGGLAEDYFMYWEDVDLNYRCARVGATTSLREDLTVVHDQGGTQGPRRGRAKSALYYFYNSRNRMLFAGRHLDRGHIWGWLWRTPKVTWEILLRGGRRQLIDQPRLLLAAVRGGLSGMGIGLRALATGPVPAPRPRQRIRRRRGSSDER